MALRFLLVALVAGMGLELPSGDELAGWTASGREWVGARMAGLSSLGVPTGRDAGGPIEGVRDPAPGATPATIDLAFDVVVEGMASDFAADLAAIREPRADADPVSDAIAGGGHVLGPDALAWTDPEPAPAGLAAEVDAMAGPPAPPIGAGTPPARSERLSSAIRLTRQALDAWASLIEGSSEAVAAVR